MYSPVTLLAVWLVHVSRRLREISLVFWIPLLSSPLLSHLVVTPAHIAVNSLELAQGYDRFFSSACVFDNGKKRPIFLKKKMELLITHFRNTLDQILPKNAFYRKNTFLCGINKWQPSRSGKIER